jgi:hypothetical protein
MSCIAALLACFSRHQTGGANGRQQQKISDWLERKSSRARRLLTINPPFNSASATGDKAIFSDVEQRLNYPAAGSVRNHYGLAICLQVHQFQRGAFNEPMSPVSRYVFLAVDGSATDASAVDHSIRTV